MVGGLRRVVIHVKCDRNRLRGYGALGVEIGPSLLLWPVAYTTACTTVQAVIRGVSCYLPRKIIALTGPLKNGLLEVKGKDLTPRQTQ